MSAPTRAPADTTGPRGGLPRMLAMFVVANLALYATYSGVVSILLPVQVEQLDPANKEINLSIVTGTSAVFATVFNPVGGMLSDRTRTRFGRRNPWMIGGAAATLLFLALMGFAPVLWVLLVGWCLAQAAANLYQAALTATVPDRVPEDRRGNASAMLGIAQSVGMVVGGLVAARFVGHLEWGYLLFGAALVAAATLFVTTTRDPRGAELPPRADEPGNPLLAQLRGFAEALGSRDFTFAFASRALMMLGFFLVVGYQVFILSDYVTLPDGLAPTDAVPILLVVNTVPTVLVVAAAGPLSDRLGRRKPFVLVSAVIAAAATLIPVLWPTWPAMIVWAAVAGTAFGVFMAVDTAIVTLVLPRRRDAARDMGVLNIANAGPQILAPFLAGLIVVALGGYTVLFACAAAASLLGAFAILGVTRVR